MLLCAIITLFQSECIINNSHISCLRTDLCSVEIREFCVEIRFLYQIRTMYAGNLPFYALRDFIILYKVHVKQSTFIK